jgi:hypothetical protein
MASLTPTPKQPARGVASVLLCDWSWPQPLKQEAAPLSLSVRQQPTTRIPQQCNQEFPFCFSVKNPPGEGKQSVGVQQPRGKGGKKGLIPTSSHDSAPKIPKRRRCPKRESGRLGKQPNVACHYVSQNTKVKDQSSIDIHSSEQNSKTGINKTTQQPQPPSA